MFVDLFRVYKGALESVGSSFCSQAVDEWFCCPHTLNPSQFTQTQPRAAPRHALLPEVTRRHQDESREESLQTSIITNKNQSMWRNIKQTDDKLLYITPVFSAEDIIYNVANLLVSSLCRSAERR